MTVCQGWHLPALNGLCFRIPVHTLPFQIPSYSLYQFQCFHISISFPFLHTLFSLSQESVCCSSHFQDYHTVHAFFDKLEIKYCHHLSGSHLPDGIYKTGTSDNFRNIVPQFLPRYRMIQRQKYTMGGSVLPHLRPAVQNLKLFFLKGSKYQTQDKIIESYNNLVWNRPLEII